MGRFATIEREPHLIDLKLLSRLAREFQQRHESDPQSSPAIFVFGYLTQAATEDALKEEIERSVLDRGVRYVLRKLSEQGVPPDRIYLNDYVYSATRGRKIDLFLQQRGDAADFPANAPLRKSRGHDLERVAHRPKALKLSSKAEMTLEVTVFSLRAGQRTILKELQFKSVTGISPTEISTKFQSELNLWKPKLDQALSKMGVGGLADKIEFSVKLVGGGARSKEFAGGVQVAVELALKAALTVKVTVPGTRYELPIELSFSTGGAYQADQDRYDEGRIESKNKVQVVITLLKF